MVMFDRRSRTKGDAQKLRQLFDAARDAMKKCHAPYSKFPVGAAIRTANGSIYAGCNIENASYPEGCCAEATAIGQMIMGGENQIAEILVVGEKRDLLSPCGGCRQRISEFAFEKTLVHLCDKQGVAETYTIGELLPASFGSKALS